MRRLLIGLMLVFSTTVPALADHSSRHIHMIKTRGCGCCTAWANIAKQYGFEVTTEETLDYAGTKKKLSVPLELAGCHTAKVGGYVVEGHVPMNAIERLLSEKPEVYGITVPGMPYGSPGMGSDPDARYDVLTFQRGDSKSAKVVERVGQ